MASDPSQSQQDTPPEIPQAPEASSEQSPSTSGKSRILIGSQRREPTPEEKKPERDWIPVVESREPAPPAAPTSEPKVEPQPVEKPAAAPATAEPVAEQTPAVETPAAETPVVETPAMPTPDSEPPAMTPPAPEPAAPPAPSAEIPPGAPAVVETPSAEMPLEMPAEAKAAPPRAGRSGPVPVPNLRRDLSDDLMREFEEVMGSVEMDAIVEGSDRVAKQAVFENESQHHGTVLTISSEDVFIDLGGREQGTVPVRQFAELPEVGAELEVIVTGFNKEDGLYDLMIPNAAASVENWDDLRDGITVEAKITGHNSGGLECEVNHIRGFIPVSQISLFRVEDMEQFVGERFTCLVTEANRDRRNLVLSRRAVLEREKQEAREQLLESLEPGQVHEGVVRKLMEFGAFVDIGGVDGLVHISQLDWGRVEHPSEILEEGQTIKVKILKIDPSGNRISLGYRDMLENPWESVDAKFPVGATVTGKVAKIMEFGAFVQLERGIEGLVHISEIAHNRVFRVSDFLHEGEEVSCVVKSVDREAQRIGLSIKDSLEPPPVKEDDKEKEEEGPEIPKKTYPKIPLKGGVERSSGDGEKFGLNW